MFNFQVSTANGNFSTMCALALLLATCFSICSAHPLGNNLVVSDSEPTSPYKTQDSVPLLVPDLEGSASGYGGGGHGQQSIIGGLLGTITGDVLRQVLRSLTGFGVKLGLNLNNEFYNAPEYGRGYGAGSYGHGGGGYGHGGGNQGHGGGGYSNGYSNVQETIAKKADASQTINNNNNNLRNNNNNNNNYY